MEIQNTVDNVKHAAANIGEKLKQTAAATNQDEGKTTRAIEHVTASLPSTVWLAGAGAAMVTAIVLKAAGRSQTANFVGQWVPTILLLGIYNKIVKVAGSDKHESPMS